MAGEKISQLPLYGLTDISQGVFPMSLNGTTYKVSGAIFGGMDTNFANSDLSADDNRVHEFNNKSLQIQGLSAFNIVGVINDITTPYVEGSPDGSIPPIFIRDVYSDGTTDGLVIADPGNEDSITVTLSVDGNQTQVQFDWLTTQDGVALYSSPATSGTTVTCIDYTITEHAVVDVGLDVEEIARDDFDSTIQQVAIFDNGNLKKVRIDELSSLGSSNDFTAVLTAGNTAEVDYGAIHSPYATFQVYADTLPNLYRAAALTVTTGTGSPQSGSLYLVNGNLDPVGNDNVRLYVSHELATHHYVLNFPDYIPANNFNVFGRVIPLSVNGNFANNNGDIYVPSPPISAIKVHTFTIGSTWADTPLHDIFGSFGESSSLYGGISSGQLQWSLNGVDITDKTQILALIVTPNSPNVFWGIVYDTTSTPHRLIIEKRDSSGNLVSTSMSVTIALIKY